MRLNEEPRGILPDPGESFEIKNCDIINDEAGNIIILINDKLKIQPLNDIIEASTLLATMAYGLFVRKHGLEHNSKDQEMFMDLAVKIAEGVDRTV